MSNQDLNKLSIVEQTHQYQRELYEKFDPDSSACQEIQNLSKGTKNG